ncbi:hypothetical protein FACS1894186_6630 [Alphaproteobacteria bacterium]|nr:hypothetical protein FACS1894186_6630 [Alphaproteobacteria bacterium]
MIPRNNANRMRHSRGTGHRSGSQGFKRFGPGATTFTRSTIFDSSGPTGKIRGTALQLLEKYSGSAKDFASSGDDIQAEICRQYADHYTRLQNQAIAWERENQPAGEGDGDARGGEDSADSPEGTAREQRPSRSERAESYGRGRDEGRDGRGNRDGRDRDRSRRGDRDREDSLDASGDDKPAEPPASQIQTEFTVPGVEKMDLSIPISVLGGPSDAPARARPDRGDGDRQPRRRGRPPRQHTDEQAPMHAAPAPAPAEQFGGQPE